MAPRAALRRRGHVMIYAVVVLPALIGIASFAVDMGRVQLARLQLQSAVDAAARAAANGLSDNTAAQKAIAIAAANEVDGSPLALLNSDVELGTWSEANQTFTVSASNRNAIRITGVRSKVRSTAIPMSMASWFGKSTVDLSFSAIVFQNQTAAAGYDIVGTDTLTLSGQTSIKRSDSSKVRVACNGAISVPWSCVITGDAYYYTTAPNEPGNGISGDNIKINTAVTLPGVSTPPGAQSLGALNVGWQGRTFTAGDYQCTSLTFGGGGPLTFSGDVNIYCSGTVDIGNGCTFNTNSGANKVTLYLTGSNTASFNMSSAFHMRVYGQNATVNLNGSSPMTGSVMSKVLNVNGSASITYVDGLSLGDILTGGSSSGGSSAGPATVR